MPSHAGSGFGAGRDGGCCVVVIRWRRAFWRPQVPSCRPGYRRNCASCRPRRSEACKLHVACAHRERAAERSHACHLHFLCLLVESEARLEEEAARRACGRYLLQRLQLRLPKWPVPRLWRPWRQAQLLVQLLEFFERPPEHRFCVVLSN